MPELSASFIVENKYGLHARPSSALVGIASEFESDIDIANGPIRVSAKSILGLLTLAAAKGVEITIYANGPDAQKAIDAIGELFRTKFGE